MTINMYIASAAWLCLLSGLLLRKRLHLHVPLMLCGITADLLLVLYLQITRKAIQTAVAGTLTALRQLHVLSSTIAVILYIPTLYFGIKLVRGGDSRLLRPKHMRVAKLAFLFRTLGFFLMFSMLK